MYAAPAILTLVLLLLETIFLVIALPETRGNGSQVAADAKRVDDKIAASKPTKKTQTTTNAKKDKMTRQESVEQRLNILKTLRRLHFLFLGIFSGVEFTLTFLTFDREFR